MSVAHDPQKNGFTFPRFPYRHFWGGVFLVGISLFILLCCAIAGWPAIADPCIADNTCFCETLRIGEWIVQPVNTWTNFYIIIPGFIILFYYDRAETRPKKEGAPPIMKDFEGIPPSFTLFYGYWAICIGIGSIFLHASMRWWGGLLDLSAMNVYVTALILYNVKRLTGISMKQYFIWLILVNIALAVVLITNAPIGTLLFTILVAIIFCFELFLQIGMHKLPSLKWLHRDWRWFALGMTLYTFGTFIWIFSNTGGPLCVPDSLIQGHGFWHFFDGVAIGLFYIYFRTERVNVRLGGNRLCV